MDKNGKNKIFSGSSLFCVDIPIKTNVGLELKIVLSIENDEEPYLSISFFGCYLLIKLNCLGLLSPLTEFGAVARTYAVACSGVRQRNFDFS
jgi:hypothetical protein